MGARALVVAVGALVSLAIASPAGAKWDIAEGVVSGR